MLVCFIAVGYKSCGPNAEKIRLKSSKYLNALFRCIPWTVELLVLSLETPLN